MSGPGSGVPTTVAQLHEVLLDELDVIRGEIDEMGVEAVKLAASQEGEIHEKLVASLEQVADTAKELAARESELAQRIELLEAEWSSADEQLTGWVDEWLIPTFALEVALKDWSNSKAMESELRALHIAYQHMSGPKAHGFDPINWHSHLMSMLGRIDEHRRRYTMRDKSSRSGMAGRLG